MFRIADDVDLPTDAVTQTYAFLARRGAGKTYSAGVFAEALLGGGSQVVVIDPVGVWWGLRLAADGNAPGIPIAIFGGEHGDIPLEPTAGAVVAQLVAEERLAVVLDISEFTDADQRRFVTDFALNLFQLKKKNRSPLQVIIEEAQEFLPQMVDAGSARMVGAVLRLSKIGRNFGIGVTLISQRPQAVHKGALNLTEVLVTGQLTGPQERKAIAGWINDTGMDAAALDELPRLPVGTVYLWSPQWLGRLVKTRFLRKRTFDASATPKAGDDVAAAAALRPIDLAKVQKAMAATIEGAKDNDPKALRARIKQLEAFAGAGHEEHLRVLQDQRDAFRERCSSYERALHQAGVTITQVTGMANGMRALRASLAAIDALVDSEMQKHVAGLPDDIQRLNTALPDPPGPRISIDDLVRPTPVPYRDFTNRGDGTKRILRALAERHPTPLTARQLGLLARLKTSGGSFSTYMSRLSVAGHITKDGGLVTITPAGLAAAGPVERPSSPHDLLAMWRARLPRKAGDMLEWLAVEGTPKTRGELATHAGLEVGGGTFSTYLSKLTANGLVDRTRGGFRAAGSLIQAA